MAKPKLTILLAAPRGFCAGVERAIAVVERTLDKFGAPVFVRHEIVHNRHVVETLKARGAAFVDELTEVPEGRPVVFSAHGVPKAVPAAAEARQMVYVDATCPLVSKVHMEAERHDRAGRDIILIGHANHPEVIGTMGQVPDGRMVLVETVEQAERVTPADPGRLAYVTQTTLSVDETESIVAVLKRRFPEIVGPRREDICYATTNRQEAVKVVAPLVEAMIVMGAPNSSNSQRLREVAERSGCPRAVLLQRASELDVAGLDDVARIGITAGASAPELLVEEVIAALAERRTVRVETVRTAEESLVFTLPRELREVAERANESRLVPRKREA